MAENRNYSYKDVDMLMTSKTIAGNFKSNISEFALVRNDWTVSTKPLKPIWA